MATEKTILVHKYSFGTADAMCELTPANRADQAGSELLQDSQGVWAPHAWDLMNQMSLTAAPRFELPESPAT